MNFTGYMSTLKYLKKHPKEWVPAGKLKKLTTFLLKL